jgi:ribonuclease P protein component
VLPAEARLRRRPDFASAIRHGERAGRPPVVVHLLAADPSSGVRVGFVVNRAVGSAVVRNRVRRRLRHLVAARLPRLRERIAGSLVVVRAAPSSATKSSAEIGRALDTALEAALARTPVAS